MTYKKLVNMAYEVTELDAMICIEIKKAHKEKLIEKRNLLQAEYDSYRK